MVTLLVGIALGLGIGVVALWLAVITTTTFH
jgi:hypothetical protein